MLLLERIATSRGQYQKSLLPPTVAREVKAWQDCGKEMALLSAQLKHGAPATMAKILENAPALPADAFGYADGRSKDTPVSLMKERSQPRHSSSQGDMMAAVGDDEWQASSSPSILYSDFV